MYIIIDINYCCLSIIVENCDVDQSYSLQVTDNEDSLQIIPLHQLDTTHTDVNGDLKDYTSSNSSKAVSLKCVDALVISNNDCTDEETDN